MTERSQITLSLTKEARAILEKQSSPRKRGEFISSLLVAYGDDAGAIGQLDIEAIKLQLLGLASANKTLEGRVLKLERQIAAMQK
jgi:hypothetical protein